MDKEVILHIKTNFSENIDQLAKLQKQLDELKVAELQLNAAVKAGNKTREEADKELEVLAAQVRNVKTAQKEYRKEIDAEIAAHEANEGSIKQMRSELKNLLKSYDELSKEDREGSIGEDKIRQINELQHSLKELEGVTGRFQRSVGDYEGAIQRALDGVIPMRTALKELKTEIQTLEFQYRNQTSLIQQQEKDLSELAMTVGKDNEEYRRQEKELENLRKEYASTGDALTQMKQAAGQMTDAIDDANTSITNFGKDNAGLKAATEGAELLLNSYTALKAGMTALGIESDELYNVFSKIQILQQGLNAINKVANMLQKESVLSQQAKVLWTNLTTTSIASLIAAKKKDAVASTEAAAADVTLAAGETAAATSAGGLTVALKAVGAAIKSIPIIGWLLAAVAALGTITGLIIKNVRAEKANNDELRVRKQLMNEIKDLDVQVLQTTQKQVVAMESNVRHLKEAKQGTEEWDGLVKQVATDLGVDEEWLRKNVDKVDDLKDAWVRLQKAMALGEAAAQKMAENQIKAATAEYEIRKLLEETEPRKRTEELKKQFNMSEKMAKNIASAFHQMRKTGSAKDFAAYSNVVNSYIEQLTKQNERLNGVIEQAYSDQKQAQEDLADTAEGNITKTGEKAVSTSKTVTKKVTKTVKELSEELEDLMVEGMADGLEKQIKEVQKASDRYVEKMKEAREQDLENAEYYDKIILEKERRTQDKIKKMRSEGYKTILVSAEKITESYNKLWQSYAPNSFYNFVKDVESITKDVAKSVDELNEQITATQDLIKQYRNTIGADNERLGLIGVDIENLKSEIYTEFKNPVKVPVEPVFEFDKKSVLDLLSKAVKSVEGIDSKAAVAGVFNTLFRVSAETPVNELIDKLNELFNWAHEQFIDIFDNDSDIIQPIVDYYVKASKIIQKAGKEYLLKYSEYEKAVATNNGIAAENNRKKQSNAETEAKIVEKEQETVDLKKKMADDEAELTRLEGELVDKQKNYNSDFAKQLLINRQTSKAMADYAKTMQDALLEQAKLGNINVIPEDFGAYIDYQIDALEEQLAKSYSKLELIAKEISDDNTLARDAFEPEMTNYEKLMAELKAYREARKQTFVDRNETPEDKGFFSNSELMENERNLQTVRNQINALVNAMEEGRKEQEEVNRLEAENERLQKERLELMYEINTAEDETDKETLQNWLSAKERLIEGNNELITQHKETMALMGYTTEEQMNQTLNGLQQQEQSFAANTARIMKNSAASVMQSVSTMTSALSDLMNAIGEDNAEMANFLEGMAYAQIGVNMAVGISEAIAAGAGVPFPANLAAIASGVAAVIGGIASAISTYKQYHRDVTSPNFAEGGLIGGRYARTRTEGRKDDVNIMASRGEYIVNADSVKKYGVGLFDMLNYGKTSSIVSKVKFADGGYVSSAMAQASNEAFNADMMRSIMAETLSEIQPVVSVKEITNVQNRVRVAERVARQ